MSSTCVRGRGECLNQKQLVPISLFSKIILRSIVDYFFFLISAISQGPPITSTRSPYSIPLCKLAFAGNEAFFVSRAKLFLGQPAL